MKYFLFAIIITLFITCYLFKKQIYNIVPSVALFILLQMLMFYIDYLYEYKCIEVFKLISTFNTIIVLIILPIFTVIVLFVYAFAILEGEIWTLSHKLSLVSGILLIIVIGIKISIFTNLLSHNVENYVNLILYCSNFIATMSLSYLLATQSYRYYRNHSTENRYDCIIVLGYRLDGYKVSKVLKDRIDMAFGYFNRHGKNIPIFLSGGKCFANKISEAQAMENEFLSLGLPKELLHSECSASNTKENFKYVATTLINSGIKNPRILIVTNYFHMLRAVSIAKSVGMNADAIGSKEHWHEPLYFKLMSREIMAFVFTQPYLVIIYIETILLLISFAYIKIK